MKKKTNQASSMMVLLSGLCCTSLERFADCDCNAKLECIGADTIIKSCTTSTTTYTAWWLVAFWAVPQTSSG
uniref:Putative secreted protein n=1 Tax=Anopheles marajoara TaxID=58244 RepID=A0A2M4CDU6_9DIPT